MSVRWTCQDCGAPPGVPCDDDACPSYHERAQVDLISEVDAWEDEQRQAWIDAGRPYPRGHEA